MQFEDQAIILGVKPFSDNKAILKCFTYNHGVISGMVNNYQSKKHKADYQMGNIAGLTWRARLKEHIGYIVLNVEEYGSFYVQNDKYKLLSLASICEIMAIMLPESECYPELYLLAKSYISLLNPLISPSLANEVNLAWWKNYLILELKLLALIGYGLELDKCVVTGEKDKLYYISPRTGKAVSYEAGREYHDRLFIIPDLLRKLYGDKDIADKSIKSKNIEEEELEQSLRITKHFLEKAFNVIHKALPLSRNLLLDRFSVNC